MNERDELQGYFLMSEAVTRMTLPADKLGELLRTSIEESGGDLPAMLRSAYRAGAAAAMIVTERNPEGLAEEFHRLLDEPEAGGQ